MDQELRELHATWLERNGEQERNCVMEAAEEREREKGVAAEILVGVETPVAFTPVGLPTMINIANPPPILQDTGSSSVSQDVVPFSDAFTDNQIATASSPTLSISTISDLTPTEFDEDIEDSGERIPACHEMFYLEDGNVEIMCGQKNSRVHSPIVSFSSPTLRDMLSSSALLNAPMSEGCPRVIFNDNAEDFGVLLKMIYTPGHVPPPFISKTGLNVRCGSRPFRCVIINQASRPHRLYPTSQTGRCYR